MVYFVSASPARSPDRRVLARAEPGRRVADAIKTVIFPGSEDAAANRRRVAIYGVTMAALFAIGVTLVAVANKRLAPLLYDNAAIAQVAGVLAEGRNQAVFDLNIESRALRREHIRRLGRTPELVVLGASHWQEGHAELARGKDMYNAHVHRDYYEDLLAVTEMLVAAHRLPRQMLITIRDNTFLPVARRKDHLWRPAVPDYRAMAARLGIEPTSWLRTAPYPQWRDRFSLDLLRANAVRALTAPELPHPTSRSSHRSLDILLPDGSILWSSEHKALFTPQNAEAKAAAFAAARRSDPPEIDPAGVDSVDRLLGFLRQRGVDIFLAHPPFNPVFYDSVADSAYSTGLRAVQGVAAELGRKYGIPVVGSFDPRQVGCTASMYIDAEHAGPECLAKILDQLASIEAARAKSPGAR